LQYDYKIDIFSLGVVFHSLLFNETIFKGKDANEKFDANKKCEIDFET